MIALMIVFVRAEVSRWRPLSDVCGERKPSSRDRRQNESTHEQHTYNELYVRIKTKNEKNRGVKTLLSGVFLVVLSNLLLSVFVSLLFLRAFV